MDLYGELENAQPELYSWQAGQPNVKTVPFCFISTLQQTDGNTSRHSVYPSYC